MTPALAIVTRRYRRSAAALGTLAFPASFRLDTSVLVELKNGCYKVLDRGVTLIARRSAGLNSLGLRRKLSQPNFVSSRSLERSTNHE